MWSELLSKFDVTVTLVPAAKGISNDRKRKRHKSRLSLSGWSSVTGKSGYPPWWVLSLRRKKRKPQHGSLHHHFINISTMFWEHKAILSKLNQLNIHFVFICAWWRHVSVMISLFIDLLYLQYRLSCLEDCCIYFATFILYHAYMCPSWHSPVSGQAFISMAIAVV